MLTASVGLLSAGCAQPAPPSALPPAVAAPSSTAAASGDPLPSVGTDPDAVRGTRVIPGGAAVPSTGPEVVLRPAAEAQAAAVPPPRRLDIEGTDIDVEVVDVGVAADDEMEIPSDFHQAGWYRYGPAPGAPSGNAVLAAHIDIGTEEMPFAQLKDVAIGAIVTVGRQGADPLEYRVTGVRNEAKASLDTEELFRRDGDHQLVIVTCGGAWLADRADYEDNVILTASPL